MTKRHSMLHFVWHPHDTPHFTSTTKTQEIPYHPIHPSSTGNWEQPKGTLTSHPHMPLSVHTLTHCTSPSCTSHRWLWACLHMTSHVNKWFPAWINRCGSFLSNDGKNTFFHTPECAVVILLWITLYTVGDIHQHEQNIKSISKKEPYHCY